MKNRIFAASYERGIELIAAGCPLDYPGALARHSAAQRKTFRAQQLGWVRREPRLCDRRTPNGILDWPASRDRSSRGNRHLRVEFRATVAGSYGDLGLRTPGHHSGRAAGGLQESSRFTSHGGAE